MAENARQSLKTRLNLSNALAILGAALLIISVVTWRSGPHIAVLLSGVVAVVAGGTLRLTLKCQECGYLLGRPGNYCQNCGAGLISPIARDPAARIERQIRTR